MSYIIESRISTGSCKCDFYTFYLACTCSNICNDKENFLFILNIAKIATSKNLLKMLGNNVNDKAGPFKFILVSDAIPAYVS